MYVNVVNLCVYSVCVFAYLCGCSVYVFAHLCVDIVCICVCICIFVYMDVECILYVYAFTHAHIQRLVIIRCYPCLLFTPYYFLKIYFLDYV